MLSCREVLERHSEYLDSLMSASDEDAVRLHLAICPACGRYDAVVRKGVNLLAQQPVVEPDPDFMRSLQYRLADEDERRTLRPVTMAASASVSIAAVLALAAWIPSLLSSHTLDGIRATMADARAAEIAWHTATAVEPTAMEHTDLNAPDVLLTSTNADVSMIDRGYTPLILEDPTAPPSYVNVSYTSFDAR